MHGRLLWLPDQAAEPDPLRDSAAATVAQLNAERTEDVLRIAAFALGVPLDALQGAQLLWLDRLGIYLFAATASRHGAQVLPLLQPMLCRTGSVSVSAASSRTPVGSSGKQVVQHVFKPCLYSMLLQVPCWRGQEAMQGSSQACMPTGRA